MTSYRVTKSEKVFDVFNVLLMIVIMIVTLYPLLYVLFASFSVPAQFMRFRGAVLWHPLGFSLASYEAVFQNINIWNGYRNTIIVVVGGVALNMVLTIIGGYVLSRQSLMLRRPLTLLTMFTMYFNGGIVPMYLMVRNYGITDSLLALILPVAINTFNLVIMRSAFEGVPESLEEAARIDGASQLATLVRVMVPVVLPTIAVLVLYYGVSHWNSWFNALIYLRTRSKYPLQLILREMIIENTSAATSSAGAADDNALIDQTIKYASIVVATVPILCLYPFLQRYFISGIMVGAVKG
ncbi:carbohydrate ABC transporter permease [Eubacteriales bacterium OttesenSCG-928-A19]|nr:carbohydrate ABC transporter permease [Eubacteriales bacterium OttesenSCG-928-A19]